MFHNSRGGNFWCLHPSKEVTNFTYWIWLMSGYHARSDEFYPHLSADLSPVGEGPVCVTVGSHLKKRMQGDQHIGGLWQLGTICEQLADEEDLPQAEIMLFQFKISM